MIIARGSDSVGCWHFPVEEENCNAAARERWQRALRLLEAAAALGEAQELVVYPVQAVLVTGRAKGAPPPLVVQVATSADLGAALDAMVAQRDFAFGDVELNSESVIYAPSGRRTLAGVFELECHVLGYDAYLTVSTRADVWLPFDLLARPQPMVARMNAPRLQLTLAGIELAVGAAGFAEDTRFAHRDRYTLRNHRVHGNVHGDVLDLQDMGYDESWIVERWPEPE